MTSGTNRQDIEKSAWDVAGPLIAAEGMELLDVEFLREAHGWVLRLFIDKAGGVGVEECSIASRAVDTALDVANIIPHEYHLEVSSPGLNRPLRRPEHFQKVVGQVVRVKTAVPVGDPPRKNFKGPLKNADAQTIIVSVEGAGDFDIPIANIAKANLEFEFQEKPHKGRPA